MDVAVDLVNGVWVEVVATVGAGAVEVGVEGVDWVSTLTLYLLLVIMVLFLLSRTFVSGLGAFLTMGLVFGWAGHSWVCCSWVRGQDLGLRPSFPSNSKYVFIFQMREG